MSKKSAGVATTSVDAAAPHPEARDWALLAFTVIMWGSAFAGLKIASETVDPVWIIAGRMTVATLVLAIPAVMEADRAARDPERYDPLDLRAIILFSLVGTVFTALPYLAYAAAARGEDSAVLAICNGASPIFTALLAHILIKGERLTWQRLLGVLSGFAGLVALVWPRVQEGMTPQATALILAVLAAGLYAGGNIATRQARRVAPIASSLVICASGAVATLVCGAFMAPWPASPSAESLLAIAALGLGPTGVAMIAYVVLVQRTGAVFVSFATYLMPLWALFIGVVFLAERPGIEALIALMLILGGVWIANRRTSAAVD